MDIPEDLPILAYSKREDPRDVLIFRQGQTESISGGMIGTSSKRRRLQLERLYPDCHFQGIRGNVQTRLDVYKRQAMYSKIPMPRVEWNEKNMKYAMCFFPLVGVVTGLLEVILGNCLLYTSRCV